MNLILIVSWLAIIVNSSVGDKNVKFKVSKIVTHNTGYSKSSIKFKNLPNGTFLLNVTTAVKHTVLKELVI